MILLTSFMKRLFAFLAAAAALVLVPAVSQAAGPPNIVFVLCDDLGFGDTGYFFQNLRKTAADRSEPWHQTPRLDALAAEGLRMPHHYCPAPVCAPSRASLLLGQHQGHANVRNNQFDKALANDHTIASVLKRAGYATACIGKWGLQGSGGTPAAWAGYPTKRGFDYFYGYVRHADGHEHYPKEGTVRGAKEVWENDTEVSNGLDKCYTTDLFTARAKKWIQQSKAANPAQPFFFFLAYDTPHAALELPTQAYPAGGGLSGGLQWTGTPGAMINTASGTVDSHYHPDYAAATWDHDNSAATPEQPWPDVYKRYATCARRIDDCLGDLVQTFKDLGVDNDTLLVFTTDNGPSKESYLAEAYDPTFFNSFGPHDGIKRDVWEGGIRVGAMIRWPGGITAGRESPLPCQFHDWLPTFAELAGVTPPARCDGVSLAATLKNTGVQRPPQVYVEYFEGGTTPDYADFLASHRGRRRNEMQAIRVGDFMGVRYNVSAHSDAFEIYNVVTDPRQATNVAASQPALQQQMKDKVLRMRMADTSAARPYDAELIPPVNVSPVTPGIAWQSYAGSWDFVPELTLMTPTASGTAAQPDLTALPSQIDTGALFTGYLQVPADGVWTFHLSAGSRAHLLIHEASVAAADHGYTPGSEISGSLPLKAGRHPFRLYWSRQQAGAAALSLQWSSATQPKQIIPDAAFFRDGTGGANTPPTAAEDRAKTTQATPIQISPLANDSDDGSPAPLSVVSITAPAKGTVTQSGNTLTYTPAPGFLGEDRFTYTITDGASQATAAVIVSVAYADNDFWFPLDEGTGSVAVEAGGWKTAAMTGFGPAAWIPGKSGFGLNFDGVDDVAGIDGFTGVTGTAARSISAWVKTTATGGNRPIVAWGPNTNGQKWTFLMNTAGQIRLEVTNAFAVGTRAVNNGQWRHVACVFSGTNVSDVRLYVDGTLESISSITPLAVNTAGTFNVKIGSDVQNRFWLGEMDDVRIHRRALTAAEIAALAADSRASAAAWRHRYYGAAAFSWTDDTDGDGMNALMEYALGRQPHCADFDTVFSLIPAPTPDAWEITTRRRRSLFGVELEPMLSTNLQSWTADGLALISTTVDAAAPAFETTTHRFTGTTPRLFCRLEGSMN
jgi:arylsulfatase A-like enzyme